MSDNGLITVCFEGNICRTDENISWYQGARSPSITRRQIKAAICCRLAIDTEMIMNRYSGISNRLLGCSVNHRTSNLWRRIWKYNASLTKNASRQNRKDG